MELLIAERIRHYRKERELTQEQLAAELGISPQSISKWECGDGYPDITLLPRIAHHFHITVDELIGNDELGQKADLEKFWDTVNHSYDKPAEMLELCRRYYRKYPENYAIMNQIGWILTENKDLLQNEMPLLREVCEKIIDGCTDQYYRQNAAEYMCAFCEDSELNRWLDLCAPSYESYRGEILEMRLWQQGKREESREQAAVNNLELVIHWQSSRGRYRGKPEMSVEQNSRSIRFLHWLGDGEVPAGWMGMYALTTMRLAAGYFGCGRTEEGFAALEEGLTLYEQWCAIPDGTPLPLGETFGGITMKKNEAMLILPSGKETHTFYGWTLCEDESDPYTILTVPRGWEWWNSVRDTPRFRAAVERAERLKKGSEKENTSD